MFDFRLARFAIVGLANTSIGLSIIFAGKALLGLTDLHANLLGYGVAVLLGFILNQKWTFEYEGKSARALTRYLMVLAVAYVANVATVLCAIDILDVDSYLAQASGIVPYALTGYLGGRWFAFAPNRLTR